MAMIYFYSGLAFVTMGVMIFLMPRKNDYFNLEEEMWLIGLFGLSHGINEWVDMFILMGWPFDVNTLKFFGGVLLPLPYIFLLFFGTKVLIIEKPSSRPVKFLWVPFFIVFVIASLASDELAQTGIAARYFLCVPGTFLAAAGLYLALKKQKREDIPKAVYISTRIAIGVFIAYGILSGLVVPKAGFYPASLVNYETFKSLFVLPVQFFRMLCAIALTASFLAITGLFYIEENKVRMRGGIKTKVTLIILATVLTIMVAGRLAIYYSGSTLFIDGISRERVQQASLLTNYIKMEIDGEVEDTKTYAARPLYIDGVIASNSKYVGMSKEDIAAQFIEKDKEWISAKDDDPLLKECLDNRLSVGLKTIYNIRKAIAEIFVTDKYGAVVASSGRTSDYYQADEEWWKAAYNNGKGDIYVGDMEFDESSGKWVIPIAVPIWGADRQVVGVCKNQILAERIFGYLEYFRLGKTGHAAVVGKDGYVLYHEGTRPKKDRLFRDEDFKRILSGRKQYSIIKKPFLHDAELFAAFSKVDSPYLLKRGTKWILIILQNKDEILGPLNFFVWQLAIISVILALCSIPLSAFFGKGIVKPIQELHAAAELIRKGYWDTKISIKTGDEIEDFAVAFRDMALDLKDKYTKLFDLSKNLEFKIEERTEALARIQEATLNMLEDLEDAKEKLERTNRELMKLDQLKSDFVSTVSHELRTPLSIIKEGISLVLDKIPGEINEKQYKILDISKYNIDRLARIIDSLLDISKIEAGKVELKRGLINLADLVKQMADSFEPKIREKGLELKLDIDRSAGSIYADPDRITQVLTNLIGNAIKFTKAGYIEISCKDKKEAVLCSIADTGVGISREDLPKVFDKFQQFERLAGAGEKGTGLGLSIAKGIIELHQGSISVESEIGKGSKFSFVLHKYTTQSLFSEFVAGAIKTTTKEKPNMSIIAISAGPDDGVESEARRKDLHTAMSDCARLIKDTLRREGDNVVNNDGDIVVIMADCDKENSVRVQYRLEEILDKYLKEKGLRDKVRMRYGSATYPDDAKTDIELINKARSVFVFSAKA